MSELTVDSGATLSGMPVRDSRLRYDRTTAMGLGRYGFECVDAAMVVKHQYRRPGPISPTPAYFLAMHGIELTLKAFLRHYGVSVREVRDRRLATTCTPATARAKELGLKAMFKEQPSDAKALQMLIELNRNQGLRHIKSYGGNSLRHRDRACQDFRV